VVEVPNGMPNPDPTHCPGSPDAPSAASGYLCLYDALEESVAQTSPGKYLEVHGIDEREGFTSPFGVFLFATPNKAGLMYGSLDIEGSWAVTAP
jgi:hypothetical protein